MSILTSLPQSLYSKSAFDSFVGGGEFAVGNAKAAAWLCQLAYETADSDKIKNVLVLWDLRLADNGIVVEEIETVLPEVSTRCFVATGRGRTIVAFAGTDPLVLANWITDFDIHITSTEAARGYNRAATAVRQQLKDIVAKSTPENAKVIVTGHSLGGALAVLTAKWIVADFPDRLECIYTFGMPRAGDAAFAIAYNAAIGDRTYRLAYGEDVVPTVAPTELGFHHVGRYLHCDANGKFDAKSLAASSNSDEPQFVRGISKEVTSFIHAPIAAALSPLQRLKLAAAAIAGATPGMRTDVAGIAIELLPPVLRDHILDRYIGGLN